MSSINELKEKTKKQLQENEKKKMGLSEMFGDQSVGKPGSQQESIPAVQQTSQLDVQQSTHPASHATVSPETHIPVPPVFQHAVIPQIHPAGHTPIHPVGGLEVHMDVKPDPQTTRQPTILSKPSKNQRIPTCKMTFNLREDIHKAFNDLYANRILQGRATEKSEMICEAIQLLINMEEEQNNR